MLKTATLEPELEELEPIKRLSRDLKQGMGLLTPHAVRYLVDYYYQMQRDRIRANAQILSGLPNQEPHGVLRWLGDNTASLEAQIKAGLDAYSMTSPLGRWCRSITGIGPVLAAGLIAHIDITQAPTVGHIWRFAGLDPTMKWNKATKRPWNSRLKTICWKIGESFIKVKGNEKDIYGKLIEERRAYEDAKNDAGDYKEVALERAEKVGKDTEAYKSYSVGRLPKGHLYMRSKRWGVKLFLAHYHEVAFECQYGTKPPKPYVMSVLGHGHEIKVPNCPM